MLGVVLVLAFVGFVFLGNDDGSDRVVSDEERAANATTAQYPLEFDVVCENGSISNAGDYRKPYKIMAFSEGSDDDWDEVLLDVSSPYSVGADVSPSTINVVACLGVEAGSEVPSGTCEFDDGLEVDRYAVKYELTLREAKTGKSIENLGTVNGPATDCPTLVFFRGGSRKIYGSPDSATLNAKLAEFAA